MAKFIRVEPLASTRARLSETIAHIAERGFQAEPVVIGRRYKPEAVLISFELYEALADLIDEIQMTPEVRARLTASGRPLQTTVEQLAEAVGVDLDGTAVSAKQQNPAPAA